MCEVAGELEKKRRELAIRADFNMCDVYKMFCRLDLDKRGVDCDDLYFTIVENLGLEITKDEVFMLFYAVDKDGDGYLNRDEMIDCFMPRQPEYASILNSRGGFHGRESDLMKYFMGDTRNCISNFIRGFVDCEVSLEHIRQKIMNKCLIKPDVAFNTMDTTDKGYLTIEDFKQFLDDCNLYPAQKNIALVFEKFDKDEDGIVSYDEFDAGITPFLSGVKDF
jgi:Ca2+-binding EF-hand superfamily protein